MYENRRRRLGDRADGFKLRHISPLNKLMPYIMKQRAGSIVFYEFDCDINRTEEFMRTTRKEQYKGLSYTHLVMAALARTIAEHPKLNRFVSGQTIYARKKIRFAMAAKTSLTEEGKEFQTITEVSEHDSLLEVARKFDEQLAIIMKDEGSENGTDKLLNIFCKLPRFILRFVLSCVSVLDYWGIMPNMYLEGLPFYCTAYLTHLGSMGGDAVFHHLYDFGNTSIFIALGKKTTEYRNQADGSIKKFVTLPFKITLDERIAEGFDFLAAMKTFKYYIENPQLLLERNENEVSDPEL